MCLHRQMDAQPDMQMHNELLGASMVVWIAVKFRAEPLHCPADGVVVVVLLGVFFVCLFLLIVFSCVK